MSLHYASWTGDINKVSWFLEQESNVDATDFNNGNTALIFAAQNGQTEVVSILLKHNASVDNQHYQGMTHTSII